MTFDEYQAFAGKAILNKSNQEPLLNFALGLAGESGEVIDLIKKKVFQGRDISLADFQEELGDVLWYIANIASEVGINLSDIVENNRRKLEERYHITSSNDGHTIAASIDGYIIRQNGPHIQLIDAATGKHIKFLSKKELSQYVRDELPWD